MANEKTIDNGVPVGRDSPLNIAGIVGFASITEIYTGTRRH